MAESQTEHVSAISNNANLTGPSLEIPKMPQAVWPSYMLDNSGVRNNEVQNIEALEDYFERTTRSGYFQSHPYDQMHMGEDMKLDELAYQNTYMKRIFGGKPDPKRDNIDLAYNHAIRQMAESPVDKDSIIGNMNPLSFVPYQECDKDAILKTFAEQRQFYKGAVDSDTERFLKARTTHKLTATTCYGKKINISGQSMRYNHVRGQNDLINRPTELGGFKPDGNLSSKTFAPNGEGGEVPLSYENVYGPDPRVIKITDEPQYNVRTPPEQYNFNDLGLYNGNEIDRHLFEFSTSEANPQFSMLFKQYKPRM